jgi:hypothetical protein
MLWPLIPSPPYRTPSSFCSLSFLESYVDTYLVRPTGHVESQLKRKCIFRSPSNITQKGEAELGQSEGYGLILSSISSVFSKPTESIGHVWSSLYLPFAHGGETCFMTVSSKKNTWGNVYQMYTEQHQGKWEFRKENWVSENNSFKEFFYLNHQTTTL